MRFGEDGRLRAVIAADNPHTFDLMRRDADTLTRALADAGIKADPQDLRFDLRQGSSHDQRQRSQMDGGWNRRGEEGPEIETQSARERSEEHTSELQSLMRISYAVFCLKKKTMPHT